MLVIEQMCVILGVILSCLLRFHVIKMYCTILRRASNFHIVFRKSFARLILKTHGILWYLIKI